jgi:hypothetical protein
VKTGSFEKVLIELKGDSIIENKDQYRSRILAYFEKLILASEGKSKVGFNKKLLAKIPNYFNRDIEKLINNLS